MASKRIRLKLKAFDHRILDASVAEIVMTAKRTHAEVIGPIPMPKRIHRFSVNRSPHIDTKSEEQFQMAISSRLLEIAPSPQIIEALGKLELPAGVHVEIIV